MKLSRQELQTVSSSFSGPYDDGLELSVEELLFVRRVLRDYRNWLYKGRPIPPQSSTHSLIKSINEYLAEQE